MFSLYFICGQNLSQETGHHELYCSRSSTSSETRTFVMEKYDGLSDTYIAFGVVYYRPAVYGQRIRVYLFVGS
jgi:hypothetical protein